MQNPKLKDSNEIIAESYVEIAKYVAKTRAYCSMIDGFKTVYRRMLFASKDIKGKNKATEFIARTMKYHPHGEASDVLVSMTCQYGRLPLYKGYGNFGGCGFGAANPRYLSAELNEIAKLMYLDLVDYADYMEGDAGEMEPEYLPSLIPYALITGSFGMTVGLPTPEIPSFNLMDLIDFFKKKLLGETINHYPRIDVGDAYILQDEKDLSPLYKDGWQRVEFQTLYDFTNDTMSIRDFPPGCRHWKFHSKKLQSLIDQDLLEYTDSTDESGVCYEYKILNPSKFSIDDLKSLAKNWVKSVQTYRLYFEHYSSVYLSSLDKIAEESLKYLRKCAIRKFEADIKSQSFKISLFQAIEKLKSSKEIKQISKKSTDYFKSLIQEWGFSEEVANSVMTKSISYLTNSHDKEYESLLKTYEYSCKMSKDPTEYLSQKYDELKSLVVDLYNSRKHSVYKSEVTDLSDLGFYFDEKSSDIVFGVKSKKFKDFGSSIIVVYPDNTGYIQSVSSARPNSRIHIPVNSSGLKARCCIGCFDNSKYLIVQNYRDRISVIPIEKMQYTETKLCKSWDEDSFVTAVVTSLEDVKFISQKGREYTAHCEDFVRSRISYADRIFSRGNEISKIEYL